MAGVLLHPTSLPGSYGIGSIGKEALHFVDWLVSAGMQVSFLPVQLPDACSACNCICSAPHP